MTREKYLTRRNINKKIAFGSVILTIVGLETAIGIEGFSGKQEFKKIQKKYLSTIQKKTELVNTEAAITKNIYMARTGAFFVDYMNRVNAVFLSPEYQTIRTVNFNPQTGKVGVMTLENTSNGGINPKLYTANWQSMQGNTSQFIAQAAYFNANNLHDLSFPEIQEKLNDIALGTVNTREIKTFSSIPNSKEAPITDPTLRQAFFTDCNTLFQSFNTLIDNY